MYELYQNIKLIVDSSGQDIISIEKNRDMLNIKLQNMAIKVRYSNYEKTRRTYKRFSSITRNI